MHFCLCWHPVLYIVLIYRNIIHYMNYSLMGDGLGALKLGSHVAYRRLSVGYWMNCFMSQWLGFPFMIKGWWQYSVLSVLSFICFGCDLLAEELFCMCVLGFITEVLGTDCPTATTGNGKFCDAFSVNILDAFREILTELYKKDEDAFM